MSGHSKWATIHRQKEVKDAARGNLFSKLGRAITIAVKTGGGVSPDTNFKLRVAIDQARAANMPKDNIQRAIDKGSGGEALDEVQYEGFGPAGVSVIVVATTDNRNRTGQVMKNIFEKAGGSLAGPGAVAFNFENKGFLLIKKTDKADEQILNLIDMGVEDVEESIDGIEVYIAPSSLSEIRKKIEEAGFEIIETELQMKPKSFQTIDDPAQASKVLTFLENLEEHDDVQKVFVNLDIPEETLSKTHVKT